MSTPSAASEIERRALLGAAGIGAIAAMAKAGGPLNPPPGPVEPSGRTLEEVYNRASSSGVNQIGPEIFNLSTAGQYRLTASKSGPGAMMLIDGPNISLDLNGHTLTSTSITSGVIEITGGYSNVTIRNGTLVGGNFGVICTSAMTNLWLEDLKFIGQRLTGVQTGHNSVRCTTLINCHAWNVGGASVAADSSLAITGFALSGGLCYLRGCTVRRMTFNGGGTPTYRGIYLLTPAVSGGSYSVVESCSVAHDGVPGGSGSTGILMNGLGQYRNNSSMGFATPYAAPAATNAGGNF